LRYFCKVAAPANYLGLDKSNIYDFFSHKFFIFELELLFILQNYEKKSQTPREGF